MEKVADNMYFQSLKTWGYTCNKMAFRQRFSSSKDMDATQRPINQNGLGTAYCVPHTSNKLMQCFYFFEEHFSKEELKRNFNFMNPLPCMKVPFCCTLFASLDKMDMAYTFT
jgi:maltose phosphorylase